MSHLTEGQFEDILQGRAEAPVHVDRCPQCRVRLDEKRALARRVHRAFSSIHAGAVLADRIQARIAGAGQPVAAAGARPHIISLRARRGIWSGLAVAAAILVFAIPRSLRIDTSAQVNAAQTALVGIHRANLDSLEELMDDDGSGKRCRCMEGKLDGGVVMPCCKRGLCMCGCQEREFQGRLVECCVIQQPNASAISVVVVPESPEALGMTPVATTTVTGQAIWQASYGSCNMASVRMGEESCCVIGQVPQEALVAVLNPFEE
jgi:hypothetical protein